MDIYGGLYETHSATGLLKTRHYLAATALLLFLLLFRCVAEIGEQAPNFYVVSKVYDGDTVELNGKEIVRLLGLDTPEEGEPFYETARAFLGDLVQGKTVRVATGLRKRDDHGRLLAFLYIDSVLVNAEIIKNDMGWVYLFPEDRLTDAIVDTLLAAQRRAMAAGSGVWAVPVVEEQYYLGNSGRMRFHRPGCPSAEELTAENKIIFDTRKEAFFDGYSPCRNCKP